MTALLDQRIALLNGVMDGAVAIPGLPRHRALADVAILTDVRSRLEALAVGELRGRLETPAALARRAVGRVSGSAPRRSGGSGCRCARS